MAGDLVFRAHVESIECAPLGMRGAFLDWIVNTRVESVISGEFAGDRFAFRVHSPSRSGLVAGMQCTVRATWTGSGYLVDENQWHGNPT
jgi:hypothetical protein